MSDSDLGLHVLLATLGFASFVLLWLAVITGSLLRNTWTSNWLRRPTLQGIHLGLSVSGLALGIFHGLGQLLPPAASLDFVDVLVPFLDEQDPIGIGVGVLGSHILILAAASMALQRRLGYAAWRALHVVTYSAFMMIVAHVLVSGRDAGGVWVWVPVLVAWVVSAALWLRSTPLWSSVRGLPARGKAYAIAVAPAQAVVKVDVRLCSRFGFCEHFAPGVFRLQQDGQLFYRAAIETHETDTVMRAIEACPSRAISLAATSDRTPSRSALPLPGTGVPQVPGLRRDAISRQ